MWNFTVNEYDCSKETLTAQRQRIKNRTIGSVKTNKAEVMVEIVKSGGPGTWVEIWDLVPGMRQLSGKQKHRHLLWELKEGERS